MSNKLFASILVIGLLTILVLLLPIGVAPNINGSNYKNVTVHTEVNITNSRSEVLNVSIYEAIFNASVRNITISAGYSKTVYCNATIRDWNGFNDVAYVNATLWHSSSSYDAADDNNTHYTNTSCTINGSVTPPYIGWVVCSFDVWYYSNNGTWMCNVTAMDYQNASGVGNRSTIFYSVYALNVTDGINYGNVPVEEYSGNTTGNVTANVSNIGNMDINITVHGYGARFNDNLAMNCSLGGNITIDNERFSSSTSEWDSMTTLSGTAKQTGLTLAKPTDSTITSTPTYWQVYINSTNNPGGNCTGYVVFTAVAP